MSSEASGQDSAALAIDLERLLAPISSERPAGEWLRDEGTYDAVRQARREDDASLPQGVWQTPLKQADWNVVATLCSEALETRSKDLQLAVWLLEAWQRLVGFSGVAPGLGLLSRLCDRFWDHLYPPLEADDAEYRLAPIEWLNEKLPLELKRIPVTHPETDAEGACSWADWELALHLSKLSPEQLKSSADRGIVTREKFLAGVTLTPTTFYLRLAEELDRAIAALAELAGLLRERSGKEAPSLAKYEDVLVAVQRFVGNLLGERMERAGVELRSEARPAAAAAVPDLAQDGDDAFLARPITSRAEAYRRLQEAADYLLRTEPHSPTPYLVQRAVSWGGMTLGELLWELLQDQADLKTVYALLGIRATEGPSWNIEGGTDA